MEGIPAGASTVMKVEAETLVPVVLKFLVLVVLKAPELVLVRLPPTLPVMLIFDADTPDASTGREKFSVNVLLKRS